MIDCVNLTPFHGMIVIAAAMSHIPTPVWRVNEGVKTEEHQKQRSTASTPMVRTEAMPEPMATPVATAIAYPIQRTLPTRAFPTAELIARPRGRGLANHGRNSEDWIAEASTVTDRQGSEPPGRSRCPLAESGGEES